MAFIESMHRNKPNITYLLHRSDLSSLHLLPLPPSLPFPLSFLLFRGTFSAPFGVLTHLRRLRLRHGPGLYTKQLAKQMHLQTNCQKVFIRSSL